MTGALLEARAVSKRFGGLLAVDAVDLSVGDREIVGLIGPNGAGKTTFFNCLTGLVTPTSGAVSFRGKPLPRRPDRVTKAGVARTFQNIRLFPHMTALENVLVGTHCRTSTGVLSVIGRGRASGGRSGRRRPRPVSCSVSSPWAGPRTGWPRTCPTVTSAGWRSPGRWPRSRGCCSLTNPPPA